MIEHEASTGAGAYELEHIRQLRMEHAELEVKAELARELHALDVRRLTAMAARLRVNEIANTDDVRPLTQRLERRGAPLAIRQRHMRNHALEPRFFSLQVDHPIDLVERSLGAHVAFDEHEIRDRQAGSRG